MLSFTIVTTCLALLAMVHASPAANRTTGRMAPRAVTSGGTSCYFACPSTIVPANTENTAFFSGIIRSPDYKTAICSLWYADTTTGFTTVYTCNYALDGNLDGTLANDGGCPLAAPSAGCGPSNNPPPLSFRRSTTRALAQPLTRGEEIVKARQYNHKKAKGVQA